ncbi:MAG: ABC transporter ATP-binding protein [Chloroflexi bacterium]|nr:ABC transporter ATP-binding protein [Chloroflexota bacterium]
MLPLLNVKSLSTHYYTPEGIVRAADGVSFHVHRGETVALVGESGCGKTVSALSIVRLIRPSGKIVGGEVLFDGMDLLRMQEKDVRRIRGLRIGMVFQEPSASFDPIYTVGAQIMEILVQHKSLSREAALSGTVELLDKVGIADAERRVHSFPHEFSGGMLQRAGIAAAISCEPQLLIADEPTTSLDVTIQAQTLELLAGLSQELGTAVLLITHNFGLVSRYCRRAYVMYAGKIVETAPVDRLYQQPLHPYTAALWSAVLSLDRPKKRRVVASGGWQPDLTDRTDGCAYFPHCNERELECEREEPALVAVDHSHYVLCHKAVAGGRNVAECATT